MGTQAEPSSEPAGGAEEEVVDDLAGEELFDIPEDLLDETDTGAPAATDADAPQAPPAEPAAADTSGLPEGYSRDARGVVHRPDGTIASKGELAQSTGQPPERPAPGAPPAKPGEPAVAGAPGEPVRAPALEFSFTSDGKSIAVPGSRVTDEGIFIPRDLMPEIQRTLSHGVAYRGSFREKLQESNNRVAEVEGRVHREVEESKHLLSFFADLLERGPVALQDWLDDFEKNKPQLMADARVAYAEALDRRRENPIKPAQVDIAPMADEPDDFLAGVDRDEMLNQLGNVLATNIRDVVVRSGVRGLTEADVTRIHQAIMSDDDELQRYFAVATEDIPEMKVSRGDVLVRQASLLKRLNYEAGVVSAVRKNATAATQADADNRRRGVGGGAPPPTAAVAGGGAGRKAAPKIPQTREELDEFMAADD